MDRYYEIVIKTGIGPNNYTQKLFIKEDLFDVELMGYDPNGTPFSLNELNIKEIDQKDLPKHLEKKLSN